MASTRLIASSLMSSRRLQVVCQKPLSLEWIDRTPSGLLGGILSLPPQPILCQTLLTGLSRSSQYPLFLHASQLAFPSRLGTFVQRASFQVVSDGTNHPSIYTRKIKTLSATCPMTLRSLHQSDVPVQQNGQKHQQVDVLAQQRGQKLQQVHQLQTRQPQKSDHGIVHRVAR